MSAVLGSVNGARCVLQPDPLQRGDDSHWLPRSCQPASLSLVTLAGTPTAVTLSGISHVTTLPDPRMVQEPMFSCWFKADPVPISAPVAMVTLPDTFTPGLSVTKSPKMASWPTVQERFTTQWRPINAWVLMMTPAQMTAPSATDAKRDIDAVGLMRVVGCLSCKPFRSPQNGEAILFSSVFRRVVVKKAENSGAHVQIEANAKELSRQTAASDNDYWYIGWPKTRLLA